MTIVDSLDKVYSVAGEIDRKALYAAVDPLLKHAESHPLPAKTEMKELLRWLVEHAYYDEAYVLQEILQKSSKSHPCMALSIGELLLEGQASSSFTWLMQCMDNALQPVAWSSAFTRIAYILGSFEHWAAFRAPRFKNVDPKIAEQCLAQSFSIEESLERVLRSLVFASQPEVEEDELVAAHFTSVWENAVLDALEVINSKQHDAGTVAQQLRFVGRTILEFGLTPNIRDSADGIAHLLTPQQRNLLNSSIEVASSLQH